MIYIGTGDGSKTLRGELQQIKNLGWGKGDLKKKNLNDVKVMVRKGKYDF